MRNGDWNGKPVFDDRDMIIFKIRAAINFMQQVEKYLLAGSDLDKLEQTEKRGRGRPKGSKDKSPRKPREPIGVFAYNATHNIVDKHLFGKLKKKRGRPSKATVELREALQPKYGLSHKVSQ